MEVVTRIPELKARLAKARQAERRIGFVPTMGYLHEGHLSLMRRAKAENDLVVASIFVNPIQFGPQEDFASYPRDLARDSRMAEQAGVDILFVPAVEEMYSRGHENLLTSVEVSRVSQGLCGASRPGHFRGVATVVTKFFHIVQPDTAYFGQKDAQQVVVIRRMVEDLNLDVRVIAAPIVREADGLAMSSRNVYLNPAERQAALVLSRSLAQAESLLRGGERNGAAIARAVRGIILQEPLASIDYIAVVNPDDLAELQTIETSVLVALAVRIGKTRLIDNLLWEE
ncbi:MAG TPA: pantoate--beta-alanine ligase [Selenomonadales bacterium]|nr:pantoate--beta-alanine ligase [Selenomonadales bacterium]